MVVAISFLLLLTLGATYAFFQISVKNNTTEASVNLHTGELNNVALQQGENSLHITLSAEDMSSSNTGDYYAVTDSSNYKKGTPNIVEIASIKTEGTIKDTCSGEIVVSISEGMADVLASGDAYLYIKGGDIEETLDLYNIKTDKTKKYTAYFDIDTTQNTEQNIQAWLKVVNKDNAPQNYLAGLTLNLTININNFKCGVEKPIPSMTVMEALAANSDETQLQSAPIDGDTLRRFQSTDKDAIKNNYICFGATSCEDKDDHMYRIIGVVATADATTGEKVGMLKIIKQTPLSSTYKWHSNKGDASYTWNNVMLYKQLNGLDTGDSANYPSNIFLTNTTYVPDTPKIGSKTWTDIIATINWRYGDISSSEATSGTAVLTKEKSWITVTEPSKIGLMYLSDYYLAYDTTTNWYNKSDKSNWLHTANNSGSAVAEWTMSRDTSNNAWLVSSNGHVSSGSLLRTYSVRPVFYLISSVQLRGTGLATDPYTISAA